MNTVTYMSSREAYDSLRNEGLPHAVADRELSRALVGRGEYLGWKRDHGFYVKGI